MKYTELERWVEQKLAQGYQTSIIFRTERNVSSVSRNETTALIHGNWAEYTQGCAVSKWQYGNMINNTQAYQRDRTVLQLIKDLIKELLVSYQFTKTLQTALMPAKSAVTQNRISHDEKMKLKVQVTWVQLSLDG